MVTAVAIRGGAAAVLVLSVVAASAEPPVETEASPPDGGRIAGRVISVDSGRPLEAANVTVQAAAQPPLRHAVDVRPHDEAFFE